MKRAFVEKRFNYRGFPCVVILQYLGFRNGYVGIPKGHKLFNIPYNYIDISCHGGLTYSGHYLYGQDDDDIWWIGFDTGHYGDGYDDKAVLEKCCQTEKDRQMYRENAQFHRFESWRMPATISYIESECIGIVDQILEKKYLLN